VSKNTEVLREWLCECADDLEALRYGSHRKYESQKPDLIWSVIESFVSLADVYGNPMGMIAVDVKWTPKTVPLVKVESAGSTVLQERGSDGQETEAACGGIQGEGERWLPFAE